MESLLLTIMERDGITLSEAKQQIQECREEIENALDTGEGDPEEIFTDFFGLEPDYIFEVLY